MFKCTPADDAATAVATKPEPPATWEVCEAYSKAECAAHEDRCSLCTSLKGKALCFDPKTAAKLPPCECAEGWSDTMGCLGSCAATLHARHTPAACVPTTPKVHPNLSPRSKTDIFHCTGGKGAGEGTVATQQADPPAPWEVCEAWNATECADHEDSCSLCTDLEGKQLCFEPFIAAKLPPFIFKCTGPPPPAPAAVAAVAKPKPWAICEAYNATECADHEDSCSLCTTPKGKQLCFDPSIAAKLPPSIFKCTGLPPPAPATASLVTMDGPRPWPACEKYDGDECEEHKSMCARCCTPKGKPLCFDPFIAAKLPDCAWGGLVGWSVAGWGMWRGRDCMS